MDPGKGRQCAASVVTVSSDLPAPTQLRHAAHLAELLRQDGGTVGLDYETEDQKNVEPRHERIVSSRTVLYTQEP